ATAEEAKPGGWGTLKGQITFSGEPPASKPLVEQGKAPVGPDFCAKDAPILSERLVVDSGTKGVKNVLVYIPKPTEVNAEVKSAAAQVEVEFDQQKCVFKPHVLAVMAGAKILLKNSDETNHNINSKLRNNPLNPNLSPFATQSYPTEKAERAPGEVMCDIHPWMKAYWLITESPYFAVTDAKGNFEIKSVPSGTQKVVVWQEAVSGGGYVTPAAGMEVSIKTGEPNTVNLSIDPGKILAQ
ncbi:carboxypeptidase regulatory-like domain-containing protein, partial [Singulisphaera rosea]